MASFAAPNMAPAGSSGGELPPTPEAFLSLFLYGAIAVFLIVFLMYLTGRLGDKTHSETKGQAYESGVLPTGEASVGSPVPFYLVAIFFIVFDVEMIFIVSWAVAYDLLLWEGFFHVVFFITILFVGLVHLWKMGGLDWGPRVQPRRGGRKDE